MGVIVPANDRATHNEISNDECRQVHWRVMQLNGDRAATRHGAEQKGRTRETQVP